MQNQINPNKIRQVLFLVFILALGILILKETIIFLSAFLGAITLYVVCRNFAIKLLINYKWKKWAASLAIVLCCMVGILIPFSWMSTVIVTKLAPLLEDTSTLQAYFVQINTYINQYVDFNLQNMDFMGKLGSLGAGFLKGLLESSMSTVSTFFFMFIILYFLLYDCFKVEQWFRHALPFTTKNTNAVVHELKNMIFSNAVGIPFVSMVQGIVALIGYWIFGVEEFVLMGILTGIASVVPLVGTMIIFIPLMIFMMANGNLYQGIGVGLWGLIVIGSVDNVVRLLLQKKLADVHPMITLFGAIMGLNIFGFFGIIFGPLLISIFLLLVKIYIDEFGRVDADEMLVK